jgi:cell division protein ZapA
MANVSIEINNREFLIACADGDEKKVKKLAEKFSQRVKGIRDKIGDLDQQRLFLLAGILAEEENQELSNDLNIEEITSVLKDITDKIDDNI